MKVCYSIFFIILLTVGILMKLNSIYYIFLLMVSLHLYNFQIKKLNIEKELSCLNIFKSNNFLGLIIFIGLIIGKQSF